MRSKHFFAASVFHLFSSAMAFSQESNGKEDYSQYLPEVRAVNQMLSKMNASPPSILTKEGLESSRKQGKEREPKNIVLKPAEKFIKGPGGNIRMVIFKSATVRAVVLNIHGGGWMSGRPENDAQINDEMARTCNVAVVSPDYRLAPESPFLACIEDCKAAARWLVANAKTEFGTDKIFISGGSAGGHLSAVTTLYIRDSLKAIDKVKGVNLIYGVYDLNRTPSVRQVTDTSMLPKKIMDETFELIFKGWNVEQRQNPAYSPLYADLHGLPPALFTVGLTDPLVDDTFFMEARWRNAGNRTYLAAYPESPHAFNYFGTKLAKAANQRMYDWINSLLQ